MVFDDDDQGYEAWLRENPNGYVFNFFGSSEAQAETCLAEL